MIPCKSSGPRRDAGSIVTKVHPLRRFDPPRNLAIALGSLRCKFSMDMPQLGGLAVQESASNLHRFSLALRDFCHGRQMHTVS